MSTYDGLVQQGMSRGEALRTLALEADASAITLNALTSPADVGATYTEAEVQAIRDDVAAIHSAVTSILAILNG